MAEDVAPTYLNDKIWQQCRADPVHPARDVRGEGSVLLWREHEAYKRPKRWPQIRAKGTASVSDLQHRMTSREGRRQCSSIAGDARSTRLLLGRPVCTSLADPVRIVVGVVENGVACVVNNDCACRTLENLAPICRAPSHRVSIQRHTSE